MGDTGELLNSNTNREIRLGKTALRKDVQTGGVYAKCIRMNGMDYSQSSHWSRLCKVKTDSIVFDWHRELKTAGKKVVYSAYTESPGRFLKIYNADGSLSALYVLRAERRDAC